MQLMLDMVDEILPDSRADLWSGKADVIMGNWIYYLFPDAARNWI